VEANRKDVAGVEMLKKMEKYAAKSDEDEGIIEGLKKKIQEDELRFGKFRKKIQENQIKFEKLEGKIERFESTRLKGREDGVNMNMNMREEGVNMNTKHMLDLNKDVMDRVKQLAGDVNKLDGQIQKKQAGDKKLAICANHQHWWDSVQYDAIVTYDDIVAAVNDFGGGSPLNHNTGIFTAPVTGMYAVSAAGRVCHTAGGGAYQTLDLVHNNEVAEYLFEQKKWDEGKLRTPCSGFRYINLVKGDTLYLMHHRDHRLPSVIYGLKFCVTLFSSFGL